MVTLLGNVFRRYSRLFILALFIIFLFFNFFRPLEIEDIWWHLATGKWIVQNHAVPREDVFSFLEKPVQQISPQWLGSSFYYLIYEHTGFLGLKIFRSMLFIGALLMVFFYSHRKIPFSLLIVLLTCAAFALSLRYQLRPFLFNLVFIQIFLMRLLEYQKERQIKALWPLPVLMAGWSNIHLGSFINGIFLIALFLFAAILQHFNLRSRKVLPGRKESRQSIKHLATVLGLCFLSFFINPYGLKGFEYPFKIFLFPQFIHFYQLQNVIQELNPPIFLLTPQGFSYVILLLFVLVALIHYDRKEGHDLTVLFLFLFSFFMFLRYARAADFFTLVVVYVTIEIADRMDWRGVLARKIYLKWITYGATAYCLFAMGSAALGSMNLTFYKDQRASSFMTAQMAPQAPDEALRFLTKNKIFGKVFNSSAYGGFLIWQSYPQHKPFVDNRQLNQDLYWRYYEILTNPEQTWGDAVSTFDFKIALLDSSHVNSIKLITYLNRHPDWVMSFVQGDSMVFLRKDLFDQHQGLVSLNQQFWGVEFAPEDIENLKARAKKKALSFWQELTNSYPLYVDVLEEGRILFYLGYYGEGMRRLKAAIPLISPQEAQRLVKFIELVFKSQKK